MASLPAFHSFDQTAAYSKKYGGLNASMDRSTLPLEAPDPSKAGESEGGSLSGSAVQSGQAIRVTKALEDIVNKDTQVDLHGDPSLQNNQCTSTAVDGAHDDDLGKGTNTTPAPTNQEIVSALASLRATASSMPLNPENPEAVAILQRISNLEQLQAAKLQSDSRPAPDYQAILSELDRLRAIASSKPFDTEDSTTAELLQHIFNLKQKLASLDSGFHPVPVLPLVDLDIMKSTIFVTVRIAGFLLQSATPAAVIAVIVNLVFYSKSSERSVLNSALFSALAVLATTLFFLASRMHTMIKTNKVRFNNKPQSDLSNVAAASYLFVLGSGGHTTEMISLIKLSQKPYIHTHRRYLMTVGDKHSLSQAKMLEQDIANRYPYGSAGTSDLVTVTRARSVHQSYITSVITSLKCFFEIVDALTNIPLMRLDMPNAKAFQSPHVIVTNGPGTGFIVGLVAFVLKLFRVVPRDRLKVVFVETWARTHSLGLTGKLFNLTQIADVFVVQSEGLAKAFNKPNIGNVNKKWAALVNPLSKDAHYAEKEAE